MKKVIKKLLGKVVERNAPTIPIDRVEKAVFVKNNTVNDFFGGWCEKDVDFLKKYQVVEFPPPPLE